MTRVVPTAVLIVETMAALVLMDAFMAQLARVGTRNVIVAAQKQQKPANGSVEE